MAWRDAAQAADQASQQMVTFQSSVRAFSNSIITCYEKYDNGHHLASNMRTKIVNSGVLYRELHLPASVALVTCLQRFMGIYTNMSLDFFVDNIERIAEVASVYSDQAKLVADLHLGLYEDTHQLIEVAQISTNRLELEIRDTQRQVDEYDYKRRRHVKKAESGQAVANGFRLASRIAAPLTVGLSLLAAAPVVGVAEAYAEHHVDKVAETQSRLMTAKGNLNDAKLAADEITGPMASYVRQLRGAITAACEFFNTINSEVQSYNQRAGLAASQYATYAKRDRLRFHYQKMQAPARNLAQLCGRFLDAVPQITANLERRVTTDSKHVEYIQEWLQEHGEQLGLASVGRQQMLIQMISGEDQEDSEEDDSDEEEEDSDEEFLLLAGLLLGALLIEEEE